MGRQPRRRLLRRLLVAQRREANGCGSRAAYTTSYIYDSSTVTSRPDDVPGPQVEINVEVYANAGGKGYQGELLNYKRTNSRCRSIPKKSSPTRREWILELKEVERKIEERIPGADWQSLGNYNGIKHSRETRRMCGTPRWWMTAGWCDNTGSNGRNCSTRRMDFYHFRRQHWAWSGRRCAA